MTIAEYKKHNAVLGPQNRIDFLKEQIQQEIDHGVPNFESVNLLAKRQAEMEELTR